MRAEPRDAAEALIEQEFPHALVALLAGSAAREEATGTSDLDLVVVGEYAEAPYRETLQVAGWPVEVFVYTPTTYPEWFASDAARRRPSLPTMCVEGLVLRDRNGLAARLKQEARELLDLGPAPLSSEELAAARYRITDLLLDLESASETHAPFVAITLIPVLAELICDANNQWRGYGKWMPRAIEAFSPVLARQFRGAVTASLRQNDNHGLIELSDRTLQLFGGRLYEGYSVGKSRV